MKNRRINIWSSPRNISTAFMYSFAQREDMTVIDEPLYAHYLKHTDTKAEHPGTAEVLASQENDGERVVQDMLTGDYPTRSILFKQMTHHLIHLEEDFLYKMDNVLLIRNPRLIIASYAKVIPNPTIHDIGIQKQWELYQQLREQDAVNAVVDAKQLLLHPKKVLSELCGTLNLDFSEKMLAWEAGARKEDGVWAKYWYANVHKSTGFQPYVEKEVHLSSKLEILAEECAEYYDKLFEFALKA